ncbi:MAG: protein kinase [Acidobacteria bacterium]|nr:protein kinase [Acidobacteriota bacterium]
MNFGQWEKISVLFEHALGLPRDEQAAYLAELARREGQSVSDEVRALLQADQDSAGFLQASALRAAAWQMASEVEPVIADMLYGNYCILSKLGAGGMGEVYLAQDESLGRQAALKFLPQVFMQDAVQLARFEREARAASALNHPNILTVYEIGQAHGRAFIATEYVTGETLRERLTGGKLAPEAAARIAAQIAEALHAAHSAGLIHRDLKPENVMLRPDGYVKLLDFGLAKPISAEASETRNLPSSISHLQSTLMGTPHYMSPEQARGAALDARSDVWSLGVTFYEMLTGEALLKEKNAEAALRRLREAESLPWQLPHEARRFQPLLQQALAIRSERRLASAQEFLSVLRRANARTSRRHGFVSAALLTLTLILLAWWRFASAPPATPLYWDMNEAAQTAFVATASDGLAQRLGANARPHSPEQIVRIKKYVDEFVRRRDSLSTTPGKESPKAVYARASVYAPFISEAFRAHQLPSVLGLYVAVVETEYHPCTQSAVGAKGLFSFMPQTAERFGLRLTPQDERCDPHKIADAAARYLIHLRERFGADADAMTLALVAYNAGETYVGDNVARLQALDLAPLNFWTLLEHNDRQATPLRPESQSYVPRFWAAAVLGEHPQRFGLEIQPLSAYVMGMN